jgi:molybdopterin-guanine dinucleotide biosynthesis protein MobB
MRQKMFSIVGKSGVGKTTLLEKLIPELKRRGRKVAAVKHDIRRFEIDYPEKDSFRLYNAGADIVLLTSAEKLALVRRCEQTPSLEATIAQYLPDVEMLLIEGFKQGPQPKIEIHRKEHSPDLLCRGAYRDPTLIAVASNDTLALDVPVLSLDDVGAIADFIEQCMVV